MSPEHEARLKLLRERAERLAARDEQALPRVLFARVVLVEVSRERYGIPVASLRTIARATPITPLPGLPAFAQGIAAVRGELVSVIDLAELRAIGRTGNSTLFALLEAGTRSVAICIDAVLGFRDVFEDELAPDLSGDDRARGLMRAVTRDLVSILAVERLLEGDQLIIGKRSREALPSEEGT